MMSYGNHLKRLIHMHLEIRSRQECKRVPVKRGMKWSHSKSMSSRICIYRCTLNRHGTGVRIANVFGATREAGSHSPLNRPNKLVNHPTHAWSDSGQVVSSSHKGNPSQSSSTCPYSSLEVIINDQTDPLGVRRVFVEAHCAPFVYHSNTRARGGHSVCAVIVLACSCHDASVV